MPRLIQDLLADRASESVAGRTGECAALLECLNPSGPVVIHLHGIAGVGKTTLLGMFSGKAVSGGTVVLRLDCRFVEPTPQGFACRLSDAIGVARCTARENAVELGRLGSRVVLVLDSYELLHPLDTWLRQEFIPSLSESVRVVLSSRHRPSPSWLTAPEWQGLFRSMHLKSLSDEESLDLLSRAGIEGPAAERIQRFARGHPLTLRLAASTHLARPELDLERLAVDAVVQEVTNLYLAEVSNPLARKGIEAASVIRRTTQSLLGAMLPEENPREVYELLRGLSFVEGSPEGFIIHDAVRESVATSLQSSDPARYQAYRRAAWRQLRLERAAAGSGDMWRHTADILYLIENPFVREAFFPTGSQEVSIEPARAVDAQAITAIAENWESRAAANSLKSWWRHAPECFYVARDETGAVSGFYLLLEDGKVDRTLAAMDSSVRAWQQHLRSRPIPKSQKAIYVRRWLSRDRGELPSAVQGACWLDVKRTYMAMRPYLRRCYISVCDLETYGPTAQRLGFELIPEAATRFDEVTHHLAFVDFGPGSIDGWLSRMAAAEMGLDKSGILDEDARELVIDGTRTGLTELEFGLLRHLREREGKAISRAELLEDVWGQEHDGGSNVVDVVVRSLRKKLGRRSAMIATVRGVGYRFRGE